MMKFDLSLMDVDAVRLKRRKKWLLFSLVPMIIAFLVALKLISPMVFTQLLKSAYTAHNYDSAVLWGKANIFLNILEPYIAHFNYGDALFIKGEYENAEDQFRQSLAKNPPQDKICDIRVNLARAIEGQADVKIKAKRYDDAIVLYDKAKTVLYGDGCAMPTNDSGKSEEAEDAKKRLSEKKDEANRARDNAQQPSDKDGQQDDTQGNQPASQSQEQKLQDQMEQAQSERAAGRGSAEGENSTFHNSNEKRW